VWNRLPPFFRVRELRIDIKNHPSEWIEAMSHDLADRVFRFAWFRVHGVNPEVALLWQFTLWDLGNSSGV